MEARLENLEKGKLPVPFSDIMKEEISKEVKSSTQVITKELHESKADADRLLRKSNLICFKVEEQDNTNAIERLKSDLEAIQTVIKDKLEIDPPTILKCTRLGKYDKDKTRPIKVFMGSEEDRHIILSRLATMRRTKHPKLEEVFLVPDLPEEDRQCRKELRTELSRRKAAGEEDLIIQRGRIVQKTSRGPTENNE